MDTWDRPTHNTYDEVFFETKEMEVKFRETPNIPNHCQPQLMRHKPLSLLLQGPVPHPGIPRYGLPHLPATTHDHRLQTPWSSAPCIGCEGVYWCRWLWHPLISGLLLVTFVTSSKLIIALRSKQEGGKKPSATKETNSRRWAFPAGNTLQFWARPYRRAALATETAPPGKQAPGSYCS